MAGVYVPNWTRLQLGTLVGSVLPKSAVEDAMKDTDNEDLYVPGMDSSKLTGGIGGVDIDKAGDEYANKTQANVEITGGSGKDAKATVTTSGNKVTAVEITTAGSGYKLNETVKIKGSQIGSNGRIESLKDINQGANYKDGEYSGIETTNTGGGSGLTLSLTIESNKVKEGSVTVDSPGGGYAVDDTITIKDGEIEAKDGEEITAASAKVEATKQIVDAELSVNDLT